MSGGILEYVAGYISGKAGNIGITVSDYNSKYFDVYNSSSSAASYQYRILGDATGEIGEFTYDNNEYKNNWYSDLSVFVDSSYPWFTRGGNYTYGFLASQFTFFRNHGALDIVGSRLVLTPQ